MPTACLEQPLPGGLYPTSEAAARLGVSPHQVRRWIYDDDIATVTDDNGQHFIPSHEITYRSLLAGQQRRGRPRGQRAVWDRIESINAGISPLEALSDRYGFSRRSTRRAGEMLPELISELRTAEHTMSGGVEATARGGAPVVPERPPWDLYVGRSELNRYGNRPRLRRVTEAVNIVLHFVDDEILADLRHRYGQTMPLAVAWLDLADVGDRAAPEVWELLRRRTTQ